MKCNNIFDLLELYYELWKLNKNNQQSRRLLRSFTWLISSVYCIQIEHNVPTMVLKILLFVSYALLLSSIPLLFYRFNCIRTCKRWISYVPLHTARICFILVTESRGMGYGVWSIGMDGGYDSSIHRFHMLNADKSLFNLLWLLWHFRFRWIQSNIEVKSIYSNITDFMPLKLQIQDLTRLLLPLNENRKTVLHFHAHLIP